MNISDQIWCIFRYWNFSIISKFQFFDIDNFADSLSNANLLAFDNFCPIYRWPLLWSPQSKHIWFPTVWYKKSFETSVLYMIIQHIMKSWLHMLDQWQPIFKIPIIDSTCDSVNLFVALHCNMIIIKRTYNTYSILSLVIKFGSAGTRKRQL